MEKYKSLFKWMIIPMVIMQLGIFADYWGDFTDNAWSVHMHYWVATVWYLFLIFQPYLATHGQLERHRTLGIIGMFLAGGVGFMALSMMHRDLETVQRVTEAADKAGPFQAWFFYGVASVEIPMILGFGVAVIMSIVKRKSLEDHAWWLVSTVFIIMMPALGRGIQRLYVGMNMDAWPEIDIMAPLYLTQVIIIGLALLAAWKYDKLKHPATWLIIGVNIYTCFLEPLGRSEVVQKLLVTLIKG